MSGPHICVCCLLSALAVGCASPSPTARADKAPQQHRAVKNTDVAPTPKDTAIVPPATHTQTAAADLRPLLLAKHNGQLPTASTLSEHPHAADALIWLAANDELVVVRGRAMTLLRHFPTPEAETLLVDLLADASSNAHLRAAAVRGLGGWDLQARPDLRDTLFGALEDPALPVAHAAAVTLHATLGSEHPQVRRRLEGSALRSQVRAALGGG